MSSTVIESPRVRSVISLRNVTLAPLLTDTTDGHSYGQLQLIEGAIEASIEQSGDSQDSQYSDDIESDVMMAEPDITFRIQMVDIPLVIQHMILGNDIDGSGVLIRKASNRSPYFAIGFKSQKSDGLYRYIWLYKVRAKPITETYATKQGDTITRQNAEVEFAAYRRIHDGRYQVAADEGESGFTRSKAAAFLTAVYEPVITPAPHGHVYGRVNKAYAGLCLAAPDAT